MLPDVASPRASSSSLSSATFIANRSLSTADFIAAASKSSDERAVARRTSLLAVRREVERNGGSWDPVRGCAADAGSSTAVRNDDEVECVGESTRAEAEDARDAAAQEAAVDLDAEEDEV